MLKIVKHDIAHLPFLLKKALTELLKNDPLRMAAATAFFTTFALPPILVIIIQALKLVLDPATVRNKLFNNLSGIVGKETVDQLMNVLDALRGLAQNWWIIIGGLFSCFLLPPHYLRSLKVPSTKFGK